ncbi:ATP-binding cassette, subfamily C, CydC [Marinobacter daqiaonensis]|uniref:ATP-binding cassette, subfamily C, CydC n=1 Tax=Marinobacter daqiaonensis TaxID=650891 RepID=A0A1I6GT72_9GAMM|nr:thiol reductant ABC exporter subunit CydC [Marinobacter daqiaonensis]SFR45289.1 ATP-binding cassette, subfamily C, CydC [Marinobacter daqiaonensis]
MPEHGTGAAVLIGPLIPWLRMLQRRRGRLMVGGLLLFVTILAGTGLLALSGWFITATALTGLLMAAGVQASLEIYAPGGGIRFLAVARTVARYLERLYNHDTVLRLVADIRVELFRGLALQPLNLRRAHRAADRVNRLTRDVDALDNLFLRLAAPPALAFGSLLLAAILFLVVAPVMIWALVPLCVLPLVLIWLAHRTLTPTREAGRHEEELRARLINALEAQPELQAAQLWHKEAADLLDRSDRVDQSREQATVTSATASGLTLVTIQLATALALILGLALWREGTISGPVAIMLTLGILGLGEAFLPLPAAFSQLGATLGAADRLNGQTGAGKASGENGGEAPSSDTVSLEALSLRRYGEWVVPPLTATLEPGERLAILGSSGSGKSTLLDVIAGLEPGHSGRLMIGDQPVDTARHLPWGNSLSYLRQQTHLFSDTLRANLLLARPDGSDEELDAVLHAVALDELVSSLPAGLDTWVGDQGQRLSGGERRRLALARALLHRGWLVLLDEPFTGVDQATTALISRRMEPWLRGRTCIMAAHGQEALPGVKRWLDLDKKDC